MTLQVLVYFTDTPTDVTADVRSVSFRRGRSRELDAFTSGSCGIELYNRARQYDPLNVAGPHYGNIRPRLRVVVTSDGIAGFDGFIEDWQFGYELSGQSIASISCIDGLALLSQTALTEYTNTTDAPGDRITAIVNRPEVDYRGPVSFDPGFTIMQADEVRENTNTLSYLQKIQDTDLGRLFVDGSGVLQYRDRSQGVIEKPRVVFADVNDDYVQQLGLLSSATLWFDAASPEPLRVDADGLAQTILQDAVLWFDAASPEYVAPVIAFNDVQLEYTSQFLYSRIQVTRENGVTQVASDAASLAKYGVRTLTRDGLLFNSDADSAAFADFLAGLYGEPAVRVARHTFALHGLSDLHARYIKRLEIGDVVRTIWRPNNTGAAFDVDSIIEGVEHRITPDRHEVTLQLTPFSRAGFILDDPNRGLLDTSELTY
jgi:hypothetical protein